MKTNSVNAAVSSQGAPRPISQPTTKAGLVAALVGSWFFDPDSAVNPTGPNELAPSGKIWARPSGVEISMPLTFDMNDEAAVDGAKYTLTYRDVDGTPFKGPTKRLKVYDNNRHGLQIDLGSGKAYPTFLPDGSVAVSRPAIGEMKMYRDTQIGPFA